MVEVDENGDNIYNCPMCDRRVTSIAGCDKHIADGCEANTHLWQSRSARSKTPTASQKTKKPKTPSKATAKTPKKTPKKAPLSETSGNGSINKFFQKAAPTPKPPRSTPTPSASQSNRKTKDRASTPSSSAPPGNQNSPDMEKALRESRELHELSKFQWDMDESDEEDAEAKQIAQRKRYDAEQIQLKKRLALFTHIHPIAAAIQKEGEEEDERRRQKKAQNEQYVDPAPDTRAAKNDTEASKTESPANATIAAATQRENEDKPRRQNQVDDEGRLELQSEFEAARVGADTRAAQAESKAAAKAAKSKAKADAKAEKARLKALADAEADSQRQSTASPTTSESSNPTETPVPPPASQKKKKKGKDKAAPPSSNPPPSASQNAGDSESSAPSPTASQSNRRKETPIPPPPPKYSPSASQGKKRSRSKSVPPSSDVAPSGIQEEAEEEVREPQVSIMAPSASQGKKRTRSRGKSVQPSSNAAPFGSQDDNFNDAADEVEETLSACQNKKRTRSQSKSVQPLTQPPASQADDENEIQEPPASTPIPTGSQSKKAKARAAKKNKKSIATVLENSSAHSRDGQAQSNIVNPMVAPSPMRKRAAGKSRLSEVESADSSSEQQRQASPVYKSRRGSFTTAYDGQVVPTERHRKASRDELEWSIDEERYDEREMERQYLESEMHQQYDVDGDEEDDATRELRETAEAEERQRQQEYEESERARLAEIEVRLQAANLRREQAAEEERHRVEAHAALMAEGRELVRARKAETKLKAKIARERMIAEADEKKRHNEEAQRERLEAEQAEGEERRRQQEETNECLRLEAVAEAEATRKAEFQRQQEEENERLRIEVESLARLEEESQRRQYEENEHLSLEEEAEIEAEVEENASEYADEYYRGGLQHGAAMVVDDSEDQSYDASHGPVSEQFMQVKLPGPTTMSKLQQSGSSYATSSFSSAPWSSAPYSTAASSTSRAPEPSQDYDSYFDNSSDDISPDQAEPPLPSQDYDAQFDNSIWDGPIEVVAERAEDNSQESAESWQGIPDTPAASTPVAPSSGQKRNIEAVQYSNLAQPAASPFRPPMDPNAYKAPESPTNAQKRRRVDHGWLPADAAPGPPRIPITLAERALSPPPHIIPSTIAASAEDLEPPLSPKSARIEVNKAEAWRKRDEFERKLREGQFDDHVRMRMRQDLQFREQYQREHDQNMVRFNLLNRLAGMTEAKAMDHVFFNKPKEAFFKELKEVASGEKRIFKERAKKAREKRHEECLFAFEQCIMDGSQENAGFYLATALEVELIEPKKICDVFVAIAAICLPPYPDTFPIGPNPHSEYYITMANNALNITAFENANNLRLKTLLWTTTQKLCLAKKSTEAQSEYLKLMDVATKKSLKWHKVSKQLRRGTEENKAHREWMDRYIQSDEQMFEDDPVIAEAEQRIRGALPAAADEELRGPGREVIETGIPDSDEEWEIEY